MAIASTLSQNTAEDAVILNRYRHLAAAIIKCATSDLKLLPKNSRDRKSAAAFFKSKWFQYLADMLDIDAGRFSKLPV